MIAVVWVKAVAATPPETATNMLPERPLQQSADVVTASAILSNKINTIRVVEEKEA